MKAYADLTYLGQLRRLRKVAQDALVQFGLSDARTALVQHGENTTYRVDAPRTLSDEGDHGLYVPGRFLLRLHRPRYQDAASIRSELAWLTALRRDVGLPVPEPVPTPEGEPLVAASTSGVSQPRRCTMLRWMRGRFFEQRVLPAHLAAVGGLMARLHGHVATWKPPAGFARRRWDWDGLFGEGGGFNLAGQAVWALVPDLYREPFWAIAERMRAAMDALGWGADAFGLIHADLHLGNVLFRGGEARPIDFDDCGYGHWVYDFAAALDHDADAGTWCRCRDALLGGYAQVRPVPGGVRKYLDLFLAARQVGVMLWAVDMSQVNARFAQRLGGWLESSGPQIASYLDGRG